MGDTKRDDQLTAVWFAAGTAATMACIERAVVASLFAHWRVWVFLVLNLLLLAILFTSKSKTPCLSNTVRQDGVSHSKLDNKERKHRSQSITDPSEPNRDHVKLLQPAEDGTEDKAKGEEDDGNQETEHQLTKEELNQRVEAFIAMFRQHLVSDAMGKSSGIQYASSKQESVTTQHVKSIQLVSLSNGNDTTIS